MRDRPRRSIIFFLAIAVVFYGMISIAVAVATADDCGEFQSQKTWNLFPPEWECQP